MSVPARRIRLQSAMEYLMTYGWSILIIAIVLAALFSLGIFSNSNFAPKAPTGSCRVFRPGGSMSTTNINLEGTCNNELPMYVAQFNGQSSYVATGTNGLPIGTAPKSNFAWVYYEGNSICINCIIYRYGTQVVGEDNWLNINVGVPGYTTYGYADAMSIQVPLDTWSFIGYTFAPTTGVLTIYINGQSQTFTSFTGNTVMGPAYIGADPPRGTGNFCQCYISNVQVYNSSLDSASVNALYAEGIGGAPINLQNLVGWWPLNGDTNDYSGNGNNGAPTNLIFTSSWTNGYTIP